MLEDDNNEGLRIKESVSYCVRKRIHSKVNIVAVNDVFRVRDHSEGLRGCMNAAKDVVDREVLRCVPLDP